MEVPSEVGRDVVVAILGGGFEMGEDEVWRKLISWKMFALTYGISLASSISRNLSLIEMIQVGTRLPLYTQTHNTHPHLSPSLIKLIKHMKFQIIRHTMRNKVASTNADDR